MAIALIAHGGAGSWRPGSEQDAVDGMRAAVEAGRAILRSGGSALDAVCATVVLLEDDPHFNAGNGHRPAFYRCPCNHTQISYSCIVKFNQTTG